MVWLQNKHKCQKNGYIWARFSLSKLAGFKKRLKKSALAGKLFFGLGKNGRSGKRVNLPLYFGWELVIAKSAKDWRTKVLKPFRTHRQYLAAVVMGVLGISGLLFWQGERIGRAATYVWEISSQADFEGGDLTNLSSTSSPGSLELATVTAAYIDTFSNTTYQDATNTTATWSGDGNITVPDSTSEDLAPLLEGAWPKLATDNGSEMNIVIGNEVYIGGEVSQLFKYNIETASSSLYSGLASVSGWSGRKITNFAYDSANNQLYLSDYYYGKLAVYDIATASATDLTAKISAFWGTREANLIYQASTSQLYLGGNDNKFAVYDIATASATDLSAKLSSLGTTSIIVMANDEANGKIYLGGHDGSYNEKLVVYDIATASATDLTAKISALSLSSYIKSLAYDDVNDKLYLGGATYSFAVYDSDTETATDLTAKINSFWGVTNMYTLIYNVFNNKVYLGGHGKFAVYDPDTETATDLFSKVSSFFGLNIINSLTYDASSSQVYLSGDSGGFAVYDPDTDQATDLFAQLSSVYEYYATFSRSILSQSENKVYLGGYSGYFGYFDLNSQNFIDLSAPLLPAIGSNNVSDLSYDASSSKVYIAGNNYLLAVYDSVAASSTSLYSKVASLLGTNGAYSVVYNTYNGKVYVGGMSGRFAVYNPDTDSGRNLSTKISSYFTAPVRDLASVASGGEVYLGGDSGQFAVYDPTTDSATDLRAQISSFWSTSYGIYSLAYDETKNKVYLAGEGGRFAVYDLATASATNLTAIVTGSSWEQYCIYSLDIDESNNKVYLGGANNHFAIYNPDTETITYLGNDINYSIIANALTPYIYNLVFVPTEESVYYLGNIIGRYVEADQAQAQSLKINNLNNPFTRATLTATSTFPSGGSINYYLSPNGGTSWESVTPGVEHNFTATGTDLRWRAMLVKGSASPVLADIGINYLGHYASGTAASYIRDAGGEATWSSLDWNAVTPAGTNVKFRTRTAATLGGLAGAAWSDYYTATGTITSADNRYLEAEATLETNSTSTPTLNDFSITYAINGPPEFEADPSASQSAAQLVNISYSVRDGDTDDGTFTPGQILPSFEYSLNDGASWQAITAGLSSGATTSQAVDDTTYTNYGLTWDAEVQLGQSYTANARIRVTIDDNEAANHISAATSSAFVLDTTPPSLGSPALIVIGTTTPATILVNASDDTSLEMCLTLDNSETNCQAYAGTSTITLATDPDTVYAVFRDSKGNKSYANASAPVSPGNFLLRDLSNVSTGEYQLFLAWGKSSLAAPDFGRYSIWLSEDSGPYSLLYENSDKNINYYFHTGLATSTNYTYKVATVDSDGNTSVYSIALGEEPDGSDGNDTSLPAITNLATSSVSTQSITITWDTNELSDSTIGYSAAPGDFSTEIGVASMLNNASGVGQHQVTLSNLAPNTTYYFQAKSSDPSGNTGIDNNSGPGYAFTTLAGPSISAVSADPVYNTTAKINWTSDQAGDSFVIYSANSNLASSTQTGSLDSVTSHAVTLSGLSGNTTYYYYVQTGVAEDTNGGEYYSFTTSQDIIAPVISNATTSSITYSTALISWDTDEPAISIVRYGTASGSYGEQKQNLNLDYSHNIFLTSLVASTTYYYVAVSADGNGNYATSSEGSFSTEIRLYSEDEVNERENTAREEGEASAGASGSSFIMIIDKTDQTPPIISDLTVSDISGQSAEISWQTDENASSLVEYGLDPQALDYLAGAYQLSSAHSVELKQLLPGTEYYFRAISQDASGNVTISSYQSFRTEGEKISNFDQDLGVIANLKAEIIDNIEASQTATLEEKFSQTTQTIKSAFDFLSRIASVVSVPSLESSLKEQTDMMNGLKTFIPAPIISGQPLVTARDRSATISWRTDQATDGQVSYANEDYYNQRKNYQHSVGKFDNLTLDHDISLVGLDPQTRYHYQLKSKSELGRETISADFSFMTLSETAEIKSYSAQVISEEEAIFKWATNLEADSQAEVIPYRNNQLDLEAAIIQSDELMSNIHEIKVSGLSAGVTYQVSLTSQTERGEKMSVSIPTFVTSAEDLAPEILQIRTESALALGKEAKVQTIISWLTNEPATTKLYYQKGIAAGENGKLTQESLLDTSYSKKHVVVITNFEPGTVYSFQAESVDSSGQATLSKTYTILTPRQKETVFQIITKNFEELFGWMGRMKQ